MFAICCNLCIGRGTFSRRRCCPLSNSFYDFLVKSWNKNYNRFALCIEKPCAEEHSESEGLENDNQATISGDTETKNTLFGSGQKTFDRELTTSFINTQAITSVDESSVTSHLKITSNNASTGSNFKNIRLISTLPNINSSVENTTKQTTNFKIKETEAIETNKNRNKKVKKCLPREESDEKTIKIFGEEMTSQRVETMFGVFIGIAFFFVVAIGYLSVMLHKKLTASRGFLVMPSNHA